MPYNTRRKSLSLPSLGIHVPTSHPRPTHRAAPSNSSNSMSPKLSTSPRASENDSHPNKKFKRSHDDDVSTSPSHFAPSKALKSSVKSEHRTPPLSPGLQMSIEMEDSEASALPEMKAIDLEGINDEIVEAVIVRLQQTRNRPHLVKELAAVLMTNVKIVQQSANPCAIISSRLSTYLKRSCWSAIAPCPLAKELETVHPRRTYFYLTVCPHQPLPDSASVQMSQSAIVTPALSSSSSTSEDSDSADADIDRRRELSMSPEVDLSSPEFDDMEDDMPLPGTPMGSLPLSTSRSMTSMTRSQKEEPPLEKDEKEFTQTADGLQKRKASGNLMSAGPVDSMDIFDTMQNEQLFGESKGLNLNMSVLPPQLAFMTSPAMQPSLMVPPKKDGEAESWSKLDAMLDWNRSPETIELDELDCLLNDY